MQRQRPNIVLILSDEHKYDVTGCYGHPLVQTPVLDRLARQGVRFTHAFVQSPVCVASRVSLMTGRYPHAHGCRGNERLMDGREHSLPALLRDAGYFTGLSGKNHCFPAETIGRAFDVVRLTGHTGPLPGVPASVAGPLQAFLRSPEFSKPTGAGHCPFPEEYCPSHLAASGALEFLQRRPVDRPFFLWLSIPDPHAPFTCPEPFASMYRPEQIALPIVDPGHWPGKPPQQRAKRRLQGLEEGADADLRRLAAIYYGQVSFVDAQVGRVVEALDGLGLREDTIVVYMSDHGDYLGEHRMVRKGSAMYDCLVRVPFIWSWPERFPPAVSGALVEEVDVLPTLLHFAGVEVPPYVQGRGFAGVVTGAEAAHRDRVFSTIGSEGPGFTADNWEAECAGLLARGGPRHPSGGHPFLSRGVMRMVRTDRWKYVFESNGHHELYDLAADPGELVNLHGRSEHAGVVDALREALLRFAVETQDGLSGVPAAGRAERD